MLKWRMEFYTMTKEFSAAQIETPQSNTHLFLKFNFMEPFVNPPRTYTAWARTSTSPSDTSSTTRIGQDRALLKGLKFTIGLCFALTTLAYVYYSRDGYRTFGTSWLVFDSSRLGLRGYRQLDASAYFELEFKLKFMFENFEQRIDFLEKMTEQMQTQTNRPEHLEILAEFHVSQNLKTRNRLL